MRPPGFLLKLAPGVVVTAALDFDDYKDRTTLLGDGTRVHNVDTGYMTTSQTVQTTAAQVNTLARRSGLRIAALLAVDEVTLRVHRKVGRTVINTDIAYNRGTDLYDVTSYTYSGPEYILGDPKVRTLEGVYAENLGDVI